MKKYGKIPPHFIYFLENEGIKVSEYYSSYLNQKDLFDKITIKLPYSLQFIEIQVIFDNIDYSLPPDFVLTFQNNFFIEYGNIIKDWNFKDSSTLFISLLKIKEIYSNKNEEIFLKEKENIKLFLGEKHNDDDLEILLTIEGIVEIMNCIKKKLNSYKTVKNSKLELLLNYGVHLNNHKNLDENLKNTIVISYCLDVSIRNRNILKGPIVHITIPLSKEGNFYMSIENPHYVALQYQNYQNEIYYLKNFESHINQFEKEAYYDYIQLNIREKILSRIVEVNLGYILEMDTFSFRQLSIYFSYNKNSNIFNSSLKSKSVTSLTPNNGYSKNYILLFTFVQGKNELEYQIINCDYLKVESKGKLEYGVDEKEIKTMINKFLKIFIELCNN